MLTLYFSLTDYENGEYIQEHAATITYSGVFPKSCNKFQVNSFSVMLQSIVLTGDTHLLDSIHKQNKKYII